MIAGAPMTSRITFNSEFARAIRLRGFTMKELARRANTSIPTASKAAHQRPVNMAPGLRLARAVSASPIVPELEEWT
jgi:transcriptional regulator with XRE-family HTH domain